MPPDGNLCCDDFIPGRTTGVDKDGNYDPGCGAGATVPGYRYPVPTLIAVPAAGTLTIVIRPRESGIVLAMLMENSGPNITITGWRDSRGKRVGIEGADGSNGITAAWDPQNFTAQILWTRFNPLPPNLGPVSARTGMELDLANANTADPEFFSAMTWLLRPKNIKEAGIDLD